MKEGRDDEWLYQIRLELANPFAELARRAPESGELASLNAILARHDASITCQLDAFTGYVEDAERRGATGDPLYRWTKDTIANPSKQAKYIKSFTVRIDGQDIYSRQQADRLEQDLHGIVGGPIVKAMSKHDTNPANNPQPPKRYRH